MTVKIRYTTIPSSRIVNLCGPEDQPYGWDPDTIKERNRRTKIRVTRTNNKEGFFTKLESSILEKGFLNPILVTTGLFTPAYKTADPDTASDRWFSKVPPDMRMDLPGLITCERIGGSRLWFAHKHNLDVPCLVNDFGNVFSDAEEIKTVEDAMAKFFSPPDTMYINESGLWISNMTHIHMEK